MPISREVVEKIRELSPTTSDVALSRMLGVSRATIIYYRNKFGITKKTLNPKTYTKKIENVEIKQKKRFFKDFQNSQQYEILQRLYTKEELDFYFEEYWTHIKEIHSSGEELTAAEKRALDNLIQTKIRINRFLVEEKQAIERINNTTNPDEVKELQTKIDKISKNIKDLQDLYISIQKTLELTKQERSKKRSSTKVNILTILKEMKNDKLRRGIGYWCYLTESAITEVFDNLRNQNLIETAQSDTELSL